MTRNEKRAKKRRESGKRIGLGMAMGTYAESQITEIEKKDALHHHQPEKRDEVV